MFNNIGAKIKGLAEVFAIVGIFIACVTGVLFMSSGDETFIIVGLGIMIGGSIAAWISGCVLYGYGEMVENSAKTAKNTILILMNVTKKSGGQITQTVDGTEVTNNSIGD